ncbi:MAG: GNAT family N-acetyltransferase [Acidimicrobiales bacterium]
MFALPDPQLADEMVRLRPWHERDAGALAAAWEDEEIWRWTSVPARHEPSDALRWIESEPLRRESSLALDLVISPADFTDDRVLGEVGMVPLAGGPARAELGWWVAPGHRRRSVATRAVGLFASWLRVTLEFSDLFAEVDVRNPASVWVAEASGLRLRIRRAGDG